MDSPTEETTASDPSVAQEPNQNTTPQKGCSKGGCLIITVIIIIAFFGMKAVCRAPTIDDFVAKAQALERKGEGDAAFEMWKKVEQLDPKRKELQSVYLRLARAALSQGDINTALDTLERSGQIDDRTPETWQLLGDIINFIQKPENGVRGIRVGGRSFPPFWQEQLERRYIAGQALQDSISGNGDY